MTRYNYNINQSERVYVNHTTILLLLKSLCEMSTPTCITDVSGCREVKFYAGCRDNWDYE